MLVLVVGGTGGLGRLVVSELVARGHPVRVMSRRSAPGIAVDTGVEAVGGDLTTGEGLAGALRDVHVVVDTSNAGRHAEQVMVAGSRRLVEASARAGVEHLLGVGIVGAEAIAPLVPYYRVKVDQEQVVRSGDVPWSWLRATQFHDFVAPMIAGLARLPVLPAPAIRYQPVERAEVASALVDAVEAGPAGRLPDLAGPEVLPLADLARVWLQVHGLFRRVVEVPLPTRYGRALREGALCNPARAVGRRTFHAWAVSQTRDNSRA